MAQLQFLRASASSSKARAVVLRASAACVLGLALTGCTLVDSTLPLRGTQINESSGTLRDDTTLLNIVRASRFEPMNFTNLSSYNGTGTLEANAQDTHNSGVVYDIVKLGTGPAASAATVGSTVKDAFVPSLKVNTANNFNLTPLENKAFYAGFLAQLGADSINLLVKA